jgi:hypothetical protein
MQDLEVGCAVRPIYGSLGAKGLMTLPLCADGQEFTSKQCKGHLSEQWTLHSAVHYEKCAILPTCKLHCTEFIAV